MGAATKRNLRPVPPRPKTLAITRELIFKCMPHLRSDQRKCGRIVSRVAVVVPAMREARATTADLAEGLGINERNADRTVKGEKPFELGDVVALAESGAGGVKFARRITARLNKVIDEIETAQLAQAAGAEHGE